MKLRLLWPVLGIGIGLAAALFAASQIIPGGGVDRLTPNIWTVIAVPLGLAAGLVALRPQRWPSGLGWSGVIYVAGIFLAARIEVFAAGSRDAATAAGHALYFQLVPWLQTGGGLLVAVWQGQRALRGQGERTLNGTEA